MTVLKRGLHNIVSCSATGSTNSLPLHARAQRPSCVFVDNPATEMETRVTH